jgi:hypothetical protein
MIWSYKKTPEFLRAFSLTINHYHRIPCAIMALATFMKPAILAPFM